MGGVPPHGICWGSLTYLFFFCSGEGAFSSNFLFLLRNRLFGASGEPFLFFLLRNPVFELKIFIFAPEIMFFSYFFLFLLPEPIFSTRPPGQTRPLCAPDPASGDSEPIANEHPVHAQVTVLSDNISAIPQAWGGGGGSYYSPHLQN